MHRCDVCTNGPPEIQDLKVEATLLLQLIATHYVGTMGFFFYLLFFIFHMYFAENLKIIILLLRTSLSGTPTIVD